VQQQNAEGINENAEASELRQSDLEIIEQQLQENILESQSPSVDTAQPIAEPEEEIDQESDQPPTQSTEDSESDDENNGSQPQGFVNRKAPEINPNAAQTTVNLTITDPDSE
jgi:hypothetical protein